MSQTQRRVARKFEAYLEGTRDGEPEKPAEQKEPKKQKRQALADVAGDRAALDTQRAVEDAVQVEPMRFCIIS